MVKDLRTQITGLITFLIIICELLRETCCNLNQFFSLYNVFITATMEKEKTRTTILAQRKVEENTEIHWTI